MASLLKWFHFRTKWHRLNWFYFETRHVHHCPLPRFAPSLLLLFACAGGLSVANVYYAEPLLDALSASAGVNVGKCAVG